MLAFSLTAITLKVPPLVTLFYLLMPKVFLDHKTDGFGLNLWNFVATTSNILMRRSLYDKIGGMRNLRCAYDWDFMLRAAALRQVQANSRTAAELSGSMIRTQSVATAPGCYSTFVGS